MLDGRSHDAIWRGRWCREHAGDEVWVAILTGLRHIHLIADPGGAALGAIPGLDIVGRRDEVCRWGHLMHLAPAQRSWRGGVLLRPYPPQRLDGRGLTQPGP